MHIIGDKVLKNIATIARESIRTVDFIGRWGGEEFCLIIPNRQAKYLEKIIEKIRTNIKNFDFDIDKTITCSFGISIYEEQDDNEVFIQKADTAMYWSKNNGKDRVQIWNDDIDLQNKLDQ